MTASPPRTPTDRHVVSAAELAAEFDAAGDEAARLTAGLTEEQGQWREAPGRWSIAECLAHLAVTNRLYLPALEDALRRGPAPGAPSAGEFKPGALARWLIASQEPPVKRRLRTPGAIAPPPSPPLAAALADFQAAHAQLRAVTDRAAGGALGGARVTSPVFPLLRMRLGTALGFLAAHERRHLWQAREVRAAAGFPGGGR